ncbi:pseudouridine synthase 1 isoform X2 [Calliopsis andreniformis]
MSVVTESHNLNTNIVEKSNKRQIDDEDSEIKIKAQKIEDTKKTVQRVKRKNYVIMLGYSGKNYFGMQKNNDTKTIESDLFSALLKANLITKEQFEDIREIKFQRAARTDKGVSAVRQIVSLKLPDSATKEEINKHLPQQIRVFSVRRVTKGFNSKNQCDARTYRYVIPTFAFAPEDPSFLTQEEELDEEVRYKQISTINGKPYKEFRFTPDMKEKLNETLKLFEGTHNFHNFTSKIKALDPRSKRFIIYFRCVEIFVANDIEFAVLEVKGQSFMLHQIRKMVAFTVGIFRNIVTDDLIKDIFSVNKIRVSTAPGLGLSLHHVHYKYYNERYGQDGIHEALDWSECDEETEQFYKEHILQNIIDTEATEATTFDWLAHFYTPTRFIVRDTEPTIEYIEEIE